MSELSKPKYEYVIQGWYGSPYGYETLTIADTKAQARGYLQDYKDNEPGTAFRIKRVDYSGGE